MDSMTASSEYNSENTVPQTLWSATLIDILIDSLRMQQDDKHIIAAIMGLQQRHLTTRDIINKVRRRLGADSGERVLELARQIRSIRSQ